MDLETTVTRLDRAQQVASELAMAVEISRDLAQCVEVREVGAVLLRTARELTGAAECALWIKGADGEILQAITAAGVQAAGTLDAERDALLLQVLERREAILDHNGKDAAAPNASPRRIALPVLFRQELVGILELAKLANPEHWGNHKLALERVLPIAGLALKNALILEENRTVNDNLKRALEGLEESNRELRIQSETISTQAAKIASQNEEIHSQSEQLAAQQRVIEAQADENTQLLRQAIEERISFQAVVSSSADGIMVVGSDRRIAMVNKALEKLTGYRAEELIGLPCSHLLDSRDSSGECLCDFACPRLGADLLIQRPINATISNKESERVWVGIATSVIRDDSGQIRGVVHTFRDMTKYKEADRMKDEFVSVASHELMTPLTALKGFAQLAQKIGARCGDNGNLMKSLEILNEEADKLIALVTRLVDISHLQARKIDVRKVRFDLASLAESAVLRLRATTNMHTFRVINDGPVYVYADRDQIEQVLTNLLGNAVKYSPSGGEIEVRIEAHEGYVQVSVSDEGIGIPFDKQGKVFERFYQAHAGPRGYSKGMGLGLYICREIVALHNGQIWLRSEEGKGSTFYFILPLR